MPTAQASEGLSAETAYSRDPVGGWGGRVLVTFQASTSPCIAISCQGDPAM